MVEEAVEEGVQFKFLADPDHTTGKQESSLCYHEYNALGEPDQQGEGNSEPVPGADFEMKCSAVLLAIGRGPDSFLQLKEGLHVGKSIQLWWMHHFKTSRTGVFAAGDVTTGETLVVKAMGSGRNAAQRVHEYLMNLEDQHESLYQHYFSDESFEQDESGETT